MASNSHEKALFSYLVVLIKHIIKWHSQRHARSMSWVNSIKNARKAIHDLLKKYPSLIKLIDLFIPKAIKKAIKEAENEMGQSHSMNLGDLNKDMLFDQDFSLDDE